MNTGSTIHEVSMVSACEFSLSQRGQHPFRYKMPDQKNQTTRGVLATAQNRLYHFGAATSGHYSLALGTRSTSQSLLGVRTRLSRHFYSELRQLSMTLPRSTDVTIPTWGTACGCMTPSGLNLLVKDCSGLTLATPPCGGY
jgi:hypothetical protein